MAKQRSRYLLFNGSQKEAVEKRRRGEWEDKRPKTGQEEAKERPREDQGQTNGRSQSSPRRGKGCNRRPKRAMERQIRIKDRLKRGQRKAKDILKGH